MKKYNDKITSGKRKNKPLLLKIIVPMILLSVLQIGIIVLILGVSGEFSYIKRFSYNSISEKTENRRNYVENDLKSKTRLVYETANAVNSVTESILKEEGLSASEVSENKELNKRILSENAEALISLIRRDSVNDAFIILNSGDLYGSPDQINMTGIYLRDTDVNENSSKDNGDIYMEMGSSEIARSLGLALDYEWSGNIDMTDRESGNYDFFYKTVEGCLRSGDTPLYNLGQWSGFSGISKSSQQSMKYTLPLVSEDGTVYGVIGVGLLKKTVLQSIPANDFFKESACYIIAADFEGNGQYETVLSSGPVYDRLVDGDTVLGRDNASEYGLYDFTSKGGECIGSIQDMTLYASGSPFRNQKWALISVADKSQTLALYVTLLRVFYISVAITLIFGMVFAFFVSKRISAPVTGMVKSLEKSRGDNTIVSFCSSGILEINNLADAVRELQVDATEYASRVSKIITMAGSKIGVFMYDLKNERVFVGESLVKLLRFEDLPDGDVTISAEEFRRRIDKIDGENRIFGLDIFREEAHAASDSAEFMYESAGGGEPKWIKFSLTRDGGSIVGLVQDITDTVTEKKHIAKVKDDEYTEKLLKANGALRDAYALAKQASNAKTDFLSRMSHDIRTPMNAIIGMTAIAQANIEDEAKVENCLGKIETSGRYLLSLINEVLDMSKIESGKFVLAEENINISDLTDTITEIIRPAAKAKGHELKVDIVDIEHENVIGDSTRIQQAFVNILSNSVKYTPEGGHIEFIMREKPIRQKKIGCYEFVFRDNGIGMTKEFLERIYEPFERAEDVRIVKESGTGLGMSITKNIIEMMDGDIIAESAPGEGTTFTVTIFLKLQENEELYTDMFSGMRALAADSDETACGRLCSLLSEVGVRAEGVRSEKEAARRIAEAKSEGAPFDFVILDLNMEDMGGIEAAVKLGEEFRGSAPVMMLSGDNCAESEPQARAAGIGAFVGKPYFKSKLVSAISSVFGEKRKTGKSLDVISVNDFTGKRALLVDDNELNREIACEILGMTGLEIEMAENGREAVDKFAASEIGYYDLIFMDIQMPVMNGYNAAREIRALPRGDAGTVPIVAMTADAFAEDVKAAKNAGMNEHVAKPLDFDRLTEVLREWLAD
ncbi:MAG: response regulator [Butyrivibrio sp.]|nr:response regulator [Butyrivibrio sp.]